MTPEERLIEEAASAWRPRGPGGVIRNHPAWHDLDEADRVVAFEVAAQHRAMEAAADPDGMNATVRAVLDRVRGLR